VHGVELLGNSSTSCWALIIVPHCTCSRQSPISLPLLTTRRRLLLADTNQLDKLLNNPDKEIRLPTAPKERTLRAPVEMMKSVQGSSSGAGSGEFHVYKQSRRREYERLKLMEDKAKAVSGGFSADRCGLARIGADLAAFPQFVDRAVGESFRYPIYALPTR
jgi:hypothetical protein